MYLYFTLNNNFICHNAIYINNYFNCFPNTLGFPSHEHFELSYITLKSPSTSCGDLFVCMALICEALFLPSFISLFQAADEILSWTALQFYFIILTKLPSFKLLQQEETVGVGWGHQELRPETHPGNLCYPLLCILRGGEKR